MHEDLELTPQEAEAEVDRLYDHPQWRQWRRKFRASCKALNALTDEMHKAGFPGVNLYLDESTMHLMVSSSHIGRGQVMTVVQEASSDSVRIHDADGGGW